MSFEKLEDQILFFETGNTIEIHRLRNRNKLIDGFLFQLRKIEPVFSRRCRCCSFATAIALITMALFLRQARIASYDIFATAFTTVGLLGLIQMAEASRRRWSLCPARQFR